VFLFVFDSAVKVVAVVFVVTRGIEVDSVMTLRDGADGTDDDTADEIFCNESKTGVVFGSFCSPGCDGVDGWGVGGGNMRMYER
jgi:hypothetical protein